jgi:hypothetical protein
VHLGGGSHVFISRERLWAGAASVYEKVSKCEGSLFAISRAR